MSSSFEQMWEANRDHVRRVLLALTWDVDLAEDCLQDTYLHARSGISNYRGDGAKAWLTAIARNVFYSYTRRKYFCSEDSLDVAAEQADNSFRMGSDDYLDLLTIRDAISKLDPSLRKALIMKHYGGYDYQEIANYLSCTPAMAKHRIWRALRKLRSAISAGGEGILSCSELRGASILDWLYGALSQKKAIDVELHIAHCSACKQNLSQFRKLATILDIADEDRRILTLIDLDERGCTTRYVWVKQINEDPQPRYYWLWHAREGWTVEYLALQGEPVELLWPDLPYPDISEEPTLRRFEGELPRPVPQGEMIDAMFMVHPPPGSHWEAELLDNGIWNYHHKHTPFPYHQGLFIVTIRLPEGAKLRKADPEPQKVSIRTGRISLTWQIITEIIGQVPDGSKWQFEADLEYTLSSP